MDIKFHTFPSWWGLWSLSTNVFSEKELRTYIVQFWNGFSKKLLWWIVLSALRFTFAGASFSLKTKTSNFHSFLELFVYFIFYSKTSVGKFILLPIFLLNSYPCKPRFILYRVTRERNEVSVIWSIFIYDLSLLSKLY